MPATLFEIWLSKDAGADDDDDIDDAGIMTTALLDFALASSTLIVTYGHAL